MSTTEEELNPKNLVYCWPDLSEIGIAKVETKTGQTIRAVALGISSTPPTDKRMFVMCSPDEARELAVRLIEEAMHAEEWSVDATHPQTWERP